ncbi:RNA polymerase sigma factor [Arachidicoccus terrestris]|uniref:RNA polymerase sigma factor n=1 Tax=Arachidicoccus terrestris TaxID=2875539 RepID=UPI001CC79FAD|nr:sigma-70 family RNA polymerase sigma factor [Arachidicoccus terrestris]UAY54676.1 sigma-70 family RNA polymerase sigma factor [Arachidicoccus terrestris]
MSPIHQKYNDDFLLSKYMQSQDNYWLGILLQRYTVLVLGVAMKYLNDPEEAKDATQQIFFHVLQTVSRHKITNFKNWLYTVAKNHCLMHIRGQKHSRMEELKEELLEISSESELDNIQDRESQLDQMQSALELLNKEQRTCISLYYLENHSYQEISVKTGYNGDQVKSYIQNGKRNLKNYMIKNLPPHGGS